jgi:transposase
MRYINDLDNKTVEELERVVKDDPSFQKRERAKAILLSNNGVSVKEICKIFNKSTRTMYRWFDRFKEKEIERLADKSGKGRKPTLNDNDIDKIKKLIKNNNIKDTCIILNKEVDRINKVSPQTLKRFLKKNEL